MKAISIFKARLSALALAALVTTVLLSIACQGDIGPQGPAGSPGESGIAGPAGEAGAPGEQGPPGVSGVMGPAGPSGVPGPPGLQGRKGPQGKQGSDGSAGVPGLPGLPGSDARDTEFANVAGMLVWRYVGEGDDGWRELAEISPAPVSVSDQSGMIVSTHASWEVVPVFTVGDRIGDYRPPGVLDGAGAFELDDNTVRVLTNHELSPGQGYPYQLANGATLSGSRISYFDIDKRTLKVKASGLAYDRIVNRYGETLEQAEPDDGDLGELRRFCSSVFVASGQYGVVDDIYFTGEETTGGQLFALDVANSVLYAVPQTGRAGYENVTVVPTGDADTIGILIGDDRQGAPLLLYIGEKNAIGDGSFLDRNGLAQGKLYTWVADNWDSTPEDFGKTGESRIGRFVEIDIYDESLAGAEHRDARGYSSQELQDALSFGSEELGVAGVGAFHFSRPEDLAVNPNNPTQVVLNSTGWGKLYPSDDWGTVYIVDMDMTSLSADVRIVYSGDDAGKGQFPGGPDFGLRSPDNLDWAADGYVYHQEDRSTSIGKFGGTSGREASIWQMDPESGQLVRIAEVNRQAIPVGAVDIDPDDLGDWETSGILDVTNLFEADATTLLVNVQAHSMRGDLFGGENSDTDLVQGSQIVLLRNTVPQDISLTHLGR